MKEILAIVPVRAGSQRVKNKNIRPFADTNLLEIKLKALLQVERIDIIVDTDCPKAMEIAKQFGVQLHHRQLYYASSKCTNSEFFHHIAENTPKEYKYLMYVPVTSPLVKVETINSVIDEFYSSCQPCKHCGTTCKYPRDYDSVNTSSLVKHHMWLNGQPLNYNPENSPNSQDLPEIHALNYAVNILPRNLMIERRNVVGYKPNFFVLDDFEGVDIDTMFDFQISEFLYKLK
jgi:N-acylneuraminate cytidylyltransferase